MATHEKNPKIAEVYIKLAETEEKHAAIWAARLHDAGSEAPIGLFVVGSAITLFTGRSVLYSGLRQVLFGLAAAASVFLIGRLVGVSISG